MTANSDARPVKDDRFKAEDLGMRKLRDERESKPRKEKTERLPCRFGIARAAAVWKGAGF
ncbi:hypothetical protein LBMAG52_25320 [Planctomycetia bacterium]|nr:hypothetical protein LBMAG52_25320 [Planctomycetia bacterium]